MEFLHLKIVNWRSVCLSGKQYCPAVGCVDIAKHSVVTLVFLFWGGVLELKSYNTEEQKYQCLTADDTEELSSFYSD